MNIVTAETPARQFQIFTGILKATGSPEEGMYLNGVASSTVRDHHGDRILESAIRDMEEQANRGLTIFLNHEYKVPEDVAGSSTSAKAVQRGTDKDGNPIWDLDLDISINDTNDRAVQAWKAIRKRGTKLGLSIGANIPEGGWDKNDAGRYDIAHVTLLETSIVGIPANPRSWISMALSALPPILEADTEPVAPEELEAAPPADDRDLEPEEQEAAELCEECGEPEATCGCGAKRRTKATAEDQPPEASSDPEETTEEQSEGGEVIATDDVAVVSAAIASLDVSDGEVTVTHLRLAIDIAHALARRVQEMTVERDEALRAKEAAEAERDETTTKAGYVLQGVADLIEEIGRTPLGRKATFREQERKLAHLEGTYGPEFMQMLEKPHHVA
jgi:HK97 family phage prohead protease